MLCSIQVAPSEGSAELERFFSLFKLCWDMGGNAFMFTLSKIDFKIVLYFKLYIYNLLLMLIFKELFIFSYMNIL